MKNFLFVAVIGFAVALLPGIANANHAMAGCGLGSMVLPQNKGWHQVGAATTNGTFGSQTFGITTGTSNCTDDAILKSEVKQEVFVSMNFETLHEEMAQGNGESLSALSYLMGCPAEAKGEFGQLTKSHYDSLGKAESPRELLQSVNLAISSDAHLNSVCRIS